MQLAELKKMSINVMIGSLIGSAVVAVVAVLVGEFNDTFGKALFTLLIVTLHALVCLGFLDSRIKGSNTDGLRVFTNTIFVLIVLSFVTAVFGIWDLLPGSLIAKLYGTYGIIAFAVLHGEMLHKTTGLDRTINNIVYSNYVLMTLVVTLLLPIVWVANEAEFPGFYYRLLAATAIIDTTLTILAVILHKLYLQKHPESRSQLFIPIAYALDANGNRVAQPAATAPRRTMHPLLVILLIFLALQFIGPLLFVLFSLGA